MSAGKIAGYTVAGIIALSVVGVGMHYLSTAQNVATAPARVIDKTMQTNNIINNYEFFHDANNNLKARVAQINTHKQIALDTTDSAEKGRLRIELAGMQQSCRELAARYNSNATKTNRSIFMGKEAPEVIDPRICE